MEVTPQLIPEDNRFGYAGEREGPPSKRTANATQKLRRRSFQSDSRLIPCDQNVWLTGQQVYRLMWTTFPGF